MVTVFHYLALLGSIMSGLLLLPALFGFGTGEGEVASILLLYSILGGFLFFSILIGARNRVADLNRISRIYLVVLTWLFFPLFMGFPLSQVFGISYWHAVFEAVSAFTTTSADAIHNIDSMPKTAILVRGQIQWLGGLATLATFALFLGPLKLAGLQQATTLGGMSVGSAGENIVYRVLWVITRAYVFGSVICFAALLLCGSTPFDAAVLTSSALSTGGYLPSSNALLDTVGSVGLLILSVFLIYSATSVFWHSSLWQSQGQKINHYSESISVVVIIILASALIFWLLQQASGWGDINKIVQLFSESIFNASSLVSTSGMESRPGVFYLISPILLVCILFVGAGSFSTGGGIKHFRMAIMVTHAKTEIKQLIYPNTVGSISVQRLEDNEKADHLTRKVWALFCLALFVIAIGSVLLALSGLSFHAAMHASVASFANAGPAYSPELVDRGVKGWPDYSEMLLQQKIILSFLMLFGRLEIVALLVALNPFYWLHR